MITKCSSDHRSEANHPQSQQRNPGSGSGREREDLAEIKIEGDHHAGFCPRLGEYRRIRDRRKPRLAEVDDIVAQTACSMATLGEIFMSSRKRIRASYAGMISSRVSHAA